MTNDKKYWAFISYSSKDSRTARWLLRRLESYRIPAEFRGLELFDGAVLGKNLRPIFRDRDELAGSSDLGAVIYKKLQTSHFLIVLCSKHAAQSKWVNKEIEDFQSMGKQGRILALILDGEPNASAAGRPEEECFPPALRYPSEPVAGDLRKEGDGRARGFLKVLAGLTQLDFDLLYRRHERARTRKLFIGAATALLLIAVFAGLSTYALHQKSIARESEQHAIASARTAQQSLSQSDYLQGLGYIKNGQIPEGMAYLASAIRHHPDQQHKLAAARAVSLLLQRSFPLLALPPLEHTTGMGNFEISPDGKTLFTVTSDHALQKWDLSSGKPLSAPVQGGKDDFNSVQFSSDGDHMLMVYGGTVRIFGPEDGGPWTAPSWQDLTITLASFSPDAQRIATAAEGGSVRVWDVVSGEPITSQIEHEYPVRSLQFSPDGRYVMTLSGDIARIWDVRTGQQWLAPTAADSTARFAQFSPDGHLVVMLSASGGAQVWDVASRKQLITIGGKDVFLSADFNPDNRRIVTAARNGRVQVWDAVTGKALIGPLPHDRVTRVGFSPDGRRIFSASIIARDDVDIDIDYNDASQRVYLGGDTVRLWNAETGELLTPVLRHEDIVTCVKFSPDSSHIVTASADKKVRVWDAAIGKSLATFIRHKKVRYARFNPGGSLIVTVSADGAAQVWDAVSGKPVTEPMGHEDSLTYAEFSHDSRRIVTASDDGTVQVWDVGTGKPLTKPMRHEYAVQSAQFSPDGSRIVTVSGHDNTQVWDAVTGKLLIGPIRYEDFAYTTALGPDSNRSFATAWVDGVQFSPDGRRIVTASNDATARVWDVASGKQLIEPIWHKEISPTEGLQVSALFSPDGSLILTAGADGIARLWDVASGQPLGEPIRHGEGITYAAFSPDGSRIVTASDDGTSRVWDTVTGKPLIEPMPHGAGLFYAAFSPDGRRIVTVADSTVLVWDAETGIPLSEPMRHDHRILSAEFSPDGRCVLTVTDGGFPHIWPVAPSADEPVPDWVAPLLEAIAGYRINDQSVLEPVNPEVILEYRQRFQDSSASDPYSQIARWFFADTKARPNSPYQADAL